MVEVPQYTGGIATKVSIMGIARVLGYYMYRKSVYLGVGGVRQPGDSSLKAAQPLLAPPCKIYTAVLTVPTGVADISGGRFFFVLKVCVFGGQGRGSRVTRV